MRRWTALAIWILLVVPAMAGAWTMYEEFSWAFSEVGGRVREFAFDWLMNTLMFEAVLGLFALWWAWRNRTHDRSTGGGYGRHEGASTNAHHQLFR